MSLLFLCLISYRSGYEPDPQMAGQDKSGAEEKLEGTQNRVKWRSRIEVPKPRDFMTKKQGIATFFQYGTVARKSKNIVRQLMYAHFRQS